MNIFTIKGLSKSQAEMIVDLAEKNGVSSDVIIKRNGSCNVTVYTTRKKYGSFK